MGGGSSEILYAVPVSEKKEGESAIYRYPKYKDGDLISVPEEKINTIKDIIVNSATKYENNNALGRIVQNGNTSTIQYTTYKELLSTAQRVGSGIVHQNLFSQPEGEDIRFIGIFSKNRPQWSTVDLACGLYNITTVPIYDTLGDQNITYVFKHTQLTTCFVNDGGVKALMKTHDLDHLKNLISFDKFTEDQSKFFQDKGVKLIDYSALLQIGKSHLIEYSDVKYEVKPDTCLTFSYTSGTTGPPKGAMISHGNFVSFVAATRFNKDCAFNETDVAISYLPLPHILEREFLFSMIYAGACIVYFSGDVQKLKDDLALVKPTVFVSVPRLFSRFHDVIKGKFKDVTGFGKSLVDHALQVKLKNVSTNGGVGHKVYDRLVFNKTKEALGGRVRLMISGSAPLLPDVHNFMKICMSAPLCEGYGSTQTTGAAFITDGRDNTVGHVGGATSNVEFKLVDIPEMQYLSTDKDDQGRPTPRGQIWVRGPGIFLGYYHDEAKTSEAKTQKDQNGLSWLKTGDVGALTHDTRALKIVDRKKNIFKLQQGEYVAAQKVQNTYLKSEAFAQIFIHGEPTEIFVVGVGVPNRKYLMELAVKLQIQGTFEQLCKHDKIRTELVAHLNQVGKKAKLAGFEQIKNIFLESEPFMNRGILTNTMKIQRHEGKKYYKNEFVQLYKEGMLKIDKK